MLDFKRTAEYFMKNSIYVFTTDIDFAPEWAIEETIDFFKRVEVPLTPFITHPSPVIIKEYGSKEKQRYVGLHPWFRSRMHGETGREVIENIRKLWPVSRAIRPHGFFTKSKYDFAYLNMGIRYDSSPCLFLQPYCMPLRSCSGLIKFPVWWEDDIAMKYVKRKFLRVDTIIDNLVIPGLKIVNVHPLYFALNLANVEIAEIKLYRMADTNLWMRTVTKHIDSDRWRDYIFKGEGVQTFITQLIQYLKRNNATFDYLDDVYKSLSKM